ncbi:MAG: hypothetical protein QNK19_11210 [Xanthomonadales bacterium]|nr:hypothetical protein [Xanthomonadales bacterium]
MKTIRLKTFLQLLTVLSTVGFISMAQAAIVVKFEVEGSKLVPKTNGKCQKQPIKPGCLKASNGRVQFSFKMKDKKCPGGKWQMDHVALGNQENSTGNISAVAAADFNADQVSGRVNPVSSNKNHILIRNYNSAVYDIWYTVYARCSGDNSVINSDPRVENDGSGQQ